jgi:hypothetical protein
MREKNRALDTDSPIDWRCDARFARDALDT